MGANKADHSLIKPGCQDEGFQGPQTLGLQLKKYGIIESKGKITMALKLFEF